MSTQQISLRIPEPIYQHLKKQAEQSHRTVEEETLNVLVATVSKEAASPDDAATLVESLEVLDDATLRNADQSRLASQTSVELEELHVNRQREGLTENEETKAAELLRQYERQMLVRAQAVALLKQRGHDIGNLLPK